MLGGSRVAIQPVVSWVVLSFRERERERVTRDLTTAVISSYTTLLLCTYVRTNIYIYTHTHTYLNRCIRTYIHIHTYMYMHIYKDCRSVNVNMSFVSSDERNFTNPSHQSVCPYQYVYGPIVARQRLGRNVTAATNTQRINRRIAGPCRIKRK
jgi:hypothetical protein